MMTLNAISVSSSNDDNTTNYSQTTLSNVSERLGSFLLSSLRGDRYYEEDQVCVNVISRWERLVHGVLEFKDSNALSKWRRASVKVKALYMFNQGKKSTKNRRISLRRCLVQNLFDSTDSTNLPLSPQHMSENFENNDDENSTDDESEDEVRLVAGTELEQLMDSCSFQWGTSDVELHNSPEQYEFMRIIGLGGSGKVFLVQHKQSRQYFAVKVLQKADITQNNRYERVVTERTILTQTTACPFITKLRYAFDTEANRGPWSSKIFFVMEHCTGGNIHETMIREYDRVNRIHNFNQTMEAAAAGVGLWDAIQYSDLEKSSQSKAIILRRFALCKSHAQFILAELIEGLSYLHQMGIVYRDLKPQNILLQVDGHIRIADFGISKMGIAVHGVVNLRSTSYVGTTEYMSPEVVEGKAQGSSTDMWGVGVVAFEMLSGNQAFEHSSNDPDNRQLFRNILTTPTSVTFPVGFDRDAAKMISSLLQRDASKRPTIEQLRKDPFFTGIDFSSLVKSSGFHRLQPRLYLLRNDPPKAEPRHRSQSANIFLTNSFSESLISLEPFDLQRQSCGNTMPKPTKSRKFPFWKFLPQLWKSKKT